MKCKNMHTKRGIINRIEENKAVVHLEDNQVVNWETHNLPSECVPGSEVVIQIKSKAEAEAQTQELAQKILHEIFNPAQIAQHHIS